MKKYLLLLPLAVMMALQANGQNASAMASQTLQIELTDAIEITFDGTGTNTGSLVKFQFMNPNQYAAGLQSAEYLLTIRSNKKFNVALNTSTPYFVYNGSSLPAPIMPVVGVLSLMLTQNTTGGNINSPFGLNQYGAITAMTQTLMTTCANGGNQQMAVKYKAEPGFSYPGGTYTVDAVYTATQM